MSPFLLPIILIIYGEFSKGYETRYISRILFYSYTLSIIFPLYIQSSASILVGLFILLFGIGYTFTITNNVLSRVFMTIPMMISFLSYTSIYLEDYTFLLSVPFYGDYSHTIFRECLLLSVICISIKEKLESKDFKLDIYITLLWLFEFLY